MINMLEAKTRLSQLVDAAERGEEVVIGRNGVPVVQLTPLYKKKLNFGFLKGKVKPIDDSLIFAMSDEEVDRFIDGKE